MRSSWFHSVAMLYIVLFGLEMMMTGGSMFDPTARNALAGAVSPTITNYSNSTSAIISTVTNIGIWVIWISSMIFLWAPTIWTGYWVWFYLVICLPISIAFIAGLVFALRGIGSS
jgi:hypothetical protein